MSEKTLGRLERLELREIWTSEAADFTPWLAQAANLATLGETLSMELEIEAQEKSVGPFRADILCKNVENGHWVLIENQLERTDHVHLGQLLTYAAGLQAVTIVWIAARFTEEHRATLDWLNAITDERFRFFGLEVELWRIGSSPPAPRFNMIAKPNNWSRSVSQAARAIEESEVSATRLLQRDYWATLNTRLDAAKGPVTGHRKPQLQQWMSYSVGRSGFNLAGVMHLQKKWIRAELYISGVHAKAYFHLLKQQQGDIEGTLGCVVDWEELPEGTDSRISIYLQGVDPGDRKDWTRQHDWLAEKLNAMHRVFAPRVRDLDANE